MIFILSTSFRYVYLIENPKISRKILKSKIEHILLSLSNPSGHVIVKIGGKEIYPCPVHVRIEGIIDCKAWYIIKV